MKIFQLYISLFIIFPFQVYSQEQLPAINKAKAKNVILLIGDGMGLSQTYAAYTLNNNFLNIYLLPHVGQCFTFSANDYITDSGAGGTAISTGKKTNNGAVGTGANGEVLETILEIAKKKNLSTGLISTSSITHATPASFYAHVLSRESHDSIALFLLNEKVDLFIGGGTKFFIDRKDKRNLFDELKIKGYQMHTVLDSSTVVNSTKAGFLLASDAMPKISEGRGDMLPNATKYAIEKLKKDSNGFFLMVEGSQIDWGGHYNNFNYVLGETLDFDKAVGEALSFAAEDGNTLVIVASDHETGGMTITDKNANGSIKTEFSTLNHSAVPVLTYSYGPGAQYFTGVFDNTMIFQNMLKAYGF